MARALKAPPNLSSGFAILAFFALRLQNSMTRNFSVQAALDIAEAVLFAELMTCAALFTLTRLDGIPRSMPLIHGLLLAGGLMALDERLNQNCFVGRAVDWHRDCEDPG